MPHRECWKVLPDVSGLLLSLLCCINYRLISKVKYQISFFKNQILKFRFHKVSFSLILHFSFSLSRLLPAVDFSFPAMFQCPADDCKFLLVSLSPLHLLSSSPSTQLNVSMTYGRLKVLSYFLSES